MYMDNICGIVATYILTYIGISGIILRMFFDLPLINLDTHKNMVAAFFDYINADYSIYCNFHSFFCV